MTFLFPCEADILYCDKSALSRKRALYKAFLLFLLYTNVGPTPQQFLLFRCEELMDYNPPTPAELFCLQIW